MLESVDLLDAYVRDSLEDNRFYSKQSWVPPAKTADAEKIHDVVIVGAGQSGLALAFQLKLRGVRRIAVVDSQEKDRAGPWWSFARMPRMRNPKMIPGPDCGNPLLRFKSWFCAAYSEVEYNSFDFVPLKYWQEYLSWFRAVLEIETINNTTVTNIEWDEAQRCLLLETNGPGNAPLRVAARKVCLATGMTAAGSWEPPEALVDGLPRRSWFGTWEQIPWQELAGKDIAVIGAGASGFDNASYALESDCRSVTVIARSPFQKKSLFVELFHGRDDSDLLLSGEAGANPASIMDAMLDCHVLLPDMDRIRLISRLFKNGRAPVDPDYLSRVDKFEQMTILEGWPIRRIDYIPRTNKVLIAGVGEREREFDRVIFATGPKVGLKYRPELRGLMDGILTWGDWVDNAELSCLELSAYPKLTPNYQFQSKQGAESGGLANVYCLAELVHNTIGMHSLQYVAPKVAAHIASSLFSEHIEDTIAFIDSLVD